MLVVRTSLLEVDAHTAVMEHGVQFRWGRGRGSDILITRDDIPASVIRWLQ